MDEQDVPFTTSSPLDPDHPISTPPGVLPLTHGGELAITEHDGDYQLRIDVGAGNFSVRLSALDAWGIRELTNGIMRARANEVAPILARPLSPDPQYVGDEPLGCCPTHGDYWTDECIRCSWGRAA